jgi:hypothetical protein
MKTKITILIIIAIFISSFLPTVSLSERSNEVKKEQDWKDLIKSEIGEELRSASQILLNQRKDTINYLLSVVNSPVKNGESFYNFYTPRNTAISLLGTFRAKEAIKTLTQWLSPKQEQSLIVDSKPFYTPAGAALVEIGLPSVLPIIERIKQGEKVYPNILYDDCLRVLVTIKGVPETESLFESAIAKEKDATKKSNLQLALDIMKEPTMHKWLEDMYKRVSEQK